MLGLDRIYNALSDEQSRNIFMNRLMYSISNDRDYIRKMIRNELDVYADDQMNELIRWTNNGTKRIVVFGAGFAACQIIETLRDFGINVDFICDNNKSIWGSERYGLIVNDPIVLQDYQDSYVVVGINAWRNDVYKQLVSMGIDEERIFLPQKDWWLGKYDQYFDLDIIKPTENEVFVDGGALDGMDSQRFLEWCDYNYSGIFAFEPDHENCIRTNEKLNKNHDIVIYEKGLWDCSTVLRFNSGNNEISSISETGDIEINTMSIDEIQKSKSIPITYIKMDIEGSEAKALDGARETIKRDRPRLAICVYHKPEDIIELPLKILDMNPNYRLYLRHYSYVDTETVLYAI